MNRSPGALPSEATRLDYQNWLRGEWLHNFQKWCPSTLSTLSSTISSTFTAQESNASTITMKAIQDERPSSESEKITGRDEKESELDSDENMEAESEQEALKQQDEEAEPGFDICQYYYRWTIFVMTRKRQFALIIGAGITAGGLLVLCVKYTR